MNRLTSWIATFVALIAVIIDIGMVIKFLDFESIFIGILFFIMIILVWLRAVAAEESIL